MHIEQASHSNQEDVENISAIEDAVFFENALGEGTLKREMEYGYCAVLRDGMDIIVGFALVRPDPELHDLLRLGVMPGFHGRGYGSWLLSHVVTRFPGPMMLMVRKNNKRAIDLYKKNDFVITGTTGESWVMRRSTSSSP